MTDPSEWLPMQKITGPCDTFDCPNPAEVHYGLEEFYCRSCHDENRKEAIRLKREYQEYLDGSDTTGHLTQPEDRPNG